MIDIKALERPAEPGKGSFADEYRRSLANRNEDPTEVDRLLSLNQRRKKIIGDFESKRSAQNKMSQEIAILKRNKQDATVQLDEMKILAEEIKRVDQEVQLAEQDLNALLATLPNMCHSSVPVGANSESNRVERTVGEPKNLGFKAKEHWELGEKLGIIDFDRAAKITGTRFSILQGKGARLERALIQFMLDLHTLENGYLETLPPFMVNSTSLFGTGQFPKFKADVFGLKEFDYYLIPTAEVPVTNYYRDEILKETDLPICFAAYTPCFRSEAGSAGKDTKGLIRQHQFNKVELVRYAHPDSSYAEFDKLVSHAEEVLKRLELPFRTVSLCTGDISFGAAKCYDLEVWLPGQNSYREISSCSNFEDFQARRANIRFRPADGKLRFVHTLNGSGLAIGRTLVAILENYQREDGSIAIPKALQPFMGGVTEIR